MHSSLRGPRPVYAGQLCDRLSDNCLCLFDPWPKSNREGNAVATRPDVVKCPWQLPAVMVKVHCLRASRNGQRVLRAYRDGAPARHHQAGNKPWTCLCPNRSSIKCTTPWSVGVRITRPAACTTFCRPGYR